MNQYFQVGYSPMETLAARVYGNAKGVSMENIETLPKKGWMPVGTVEFCLEAMNHQGIKVPEPLDYPTSLKKWEVIPHKKMSYGELKKLGWSPEQTQGLHVKPVQTKLPTEFWWDETLLWVAPWIGFDAEWRVYVCDGEVVGVGRYDDHDSEYDLDIATAQKMVEDYVDQPAGWGLDVGLFNGSSHLVEVNDGWALGLYQGCKQAEYLGLIEARWKELSGGY